MKHLKVTLIVLVSIFLFVIAGTFKQMGVHILGAGPPPVSQWVVNLKAVLTGLMYYALTLAGILAGVIFDALAEESKGARVSWTQITDYLKMAQSWRGLVASPLIFLTVYMGVRGNPIAVPFILLAFQNGFFWKSAMSRLSAAN